MVDRQVRYEVEAIDMKFAEAQNKHDATVVADRFALDADSSVGLDRWW